MFPLFAAAGILFNAATQVPAKSTAPKLEFDGKSFVVTLNAKALKVTTVPVAFASQPSTTKALYRKDDAYVVWDARGMSIRKKDKIVTTRLGGAPISEKFWSKLEAAQNRLKIDVGGYSAGAAELIDHRRIGSEVFMALRWRTPSGSVWFDALTAIDLASKSPAVALIERFSKIESAHGKGALMLTEAEVVAVDAGPSQWQLIRFDRTKRKSTRQEFEGGLQSLTELTKGSFGFVSATGYETQSAGRLDWNSGRATILVEAKGEIGFVPGTGPILFWIRDGAGLWLNDVESSAKLKLDPDARFRRIGANVVVWTEEKGPVEAVLYQPERWLRLASWKRPAPKSKP